MDPFFFRFSVEVLLAELFPFFDFVFDLQAVVTLCAQLLIQLYASQFETLHALLSWSVAMLVILSTIKFLFFFLFFF